jgi:hypothetical protein
MAIANPVGIIRTSPGAIFKDLSIQAAKSSPAASIEFMIDLIKNSPDEMADLMEDRKNGQVSKP